MKQSTPVGKCRPIPLYGDLETRYGHSSLRYRERAAWSRSEKASEYRIPTADVVGADLELRFAEPKQGERPSEHEPDSRSVHARADEARRGALQLVPVQAAELERAVGRGVDERPRQVELLERVSLGWRSPTPRHADSNDRRAAYRPVPPWARARERSCRQG